MAVEDALINVDEIHNVSYHRYLIKMNGAEQQLDVALKDGTTFHFYHTTLNEFKSIRALFFDEDVV